MKIQNGPKDWFVVKIVMTQPYYHWQICSIRKSVIEFSRLVVKVSIVWFSIDIQNPLVIRNINGHAKRIPLVSQIVIFVGSIGPYSIKINCIIFQNYKRLWILILLLVVFITKESQGWVGFIEPKNIEYSDLSIVPIKWNKNFETDWHLKRLQNILFWIFSLKKQPDLAPDVLKKKKLLACFLANVFMGV